MWVRAAGTNPPSYCDIVFRVVFACLLTTGERVHYKCRFRQCTVSRVGGCSDVIRP